MGTKWIVKLMMVFLFSGLMIGLGITGASGQTQADTGGKRKIIKLRVTAGHPNSALWVEKMQTFLIPEIKKRVLSQTKDYQVECEELYGGTVAKLGEELEAVESGVADMSMVSIVFEMSKLHLHQFPWWFPFGSSDLLQVIKISHLTWDKFPALDGTFTKFNQKRLALAGLGSYHFVTRFPIRTMEDMKGKKIAHGGPMVPWFKPLGSVGVQSRLNEAYTCLQTGVYDGWAMEPNATVSFKLFEVAPYYTIVGLGAGIPQIVTFNLRTWNKLPKEVQEIIAQAGKEYEKILADTLEKDHYAKIEFMKKQGTKVYDMPQAERTRFAKAMDEAGIANSMAKESDKMGFPGSDLARFYTQALSKDGYKWPYVPTIK